MSGPSIYLDLPPASLFKFPPASIPETVPPPSADYIRASPFSISATTYNALLDAKVPITVAILYAATVTLLNAINKQRGNKPWAISQTWFFHAFVLAHNILLAGYSALTFAALIRALQQTWPGWTNEHGIAGALDALCKLHGPRGFGDAATFNDTSSLWEVKNKLIHLGESGLPESTDVGRLWNEGLAFWGWLFYVSKFYEVLDTAIIIAKGKRSSTLQTYHHAGAMLGMWAGIRYMSPPIWMFVLVNSGIHALMYTYYTLSTLGIRVPQAFKRTLTTLQIAQFVIGTTYALLHLFVSYTVPVSTPYTFVSTVTAAASAVSSAASSGISAASSAAVTGGFSGMLKKLAFRAAGEEGLAENVRNQDGIHFGHEASKLVETIKTETRYRNEWQKVHCIDTSGQAFAILLNAMYLLPLTALFVRFFVRSYTHRTASSIKNHVKKSGKDAAKGVNREVEHVGKTAESAIEPAADAVLKEGRALADSAKKINMDDVKANGAAALRTAKERVGQAGEYGKAVKDAAKEKVGQAGEYGKAVKDAAREKVGQAGEYGKAVKDSAKERASQASEYGKSLKDGAQKRRDELMAHNKGARSGTQAKGEKGQKNQDSNGEPRGANGAARPDDDHDETSNRTHQQYPNADSQDAVGQSEEFDEADGHDDKERQDQGNDVNDEDHDDDDGDLPESYTDISNHPYDSDILKRPNA